MSDGQVFKVLKYLPHTLGTWQLSFSSKMFAHWTRCHHTFPWTDERRVNGVVNPLNSLFPTPTLTLRIFITCLSEKQLKSVDFSAINGNSGYPKSSSTLILKNWKLGTSVDMLGCTLVEGRVITNCMIFAFFEKAQNVCWQMTDQLLENLKRNLDIYWTFSTLPRIRVFLNRTLYPNTWPDYKSLVNPDNNNFWCYVRSNWDQLFVVLSLNFPNTLIQ